MEEVAEIRTSGKAKVFYSMKDGIVVRFLTGCCSCDIKFFIAKSGNNFDIMRQFDDKSPEKAGQAKSETEAKGLIVRRLSEAHDPTGEHKLAERLRGF